MVAFIFATIRLRIADKKWPHLSETTQFLTDKILNPGQGVGMHSAIVRPEPGFEVRYIPAALHWMKTNRSFDCQERYRAGWVD